MISLTWITVLLSIGMLQAAIWPEQTLLENILSLIELSLVAAVAAVWGWRWRDLSGGLLPAKCVVAITICCALPFAIEHFFKRPYFEIGATSDLQSARVLGNLALALSACAAQRQMSALAILASMFLALFACLMPSSPLLYVLLGAYSLAATCWLVSRHWEGINAHIPRHRRRAIPKRAAGAMLAAASALCCLSWLLARGAGASLVLRGIVSASGGQGDYDPFARRGVFDGDQLVSAQENAFSFGPVDSDIFLDSEEPSLFDMFQDMYDEPENKIKRSERAIALPFRQSPQAETKIAEQEQAGRQFETIRRGRPKTPPRPEDLPTRHVLEVIGRTPLHLRTHVYNGWDGRTWYWRGDSGAVALEMDMCDKVPWLKIETGITPSAAIIVEAHSLRSLRYDDSMIPTPAGATRLRIADVDRVEMFRRAADSCVAMDRQRIPRLTVFHFESQLMLRQALAETPFVEAKYVNLDRGTKLRELVAEILDDLPRGWRQIEAISQYVRLRHSLDNAVRVPVECSDAVAWFLFEAKSGPDFLFASATVELLRQAGYHARLARGFYARPERYDERKRVTPVLAQDVHFWAEVSSDGCNWLVVESTPGYAALEPPVGLFENLGSVLATVWGWMRQHAALMATLGMLATVSLWRREWLVYAAAWLWWWAGCRGALRGHVLGTLWLLDRRARLTSSPRRTHEPIERWLRRAFPVSASGAQDAFSRLCQWALYGPGQPCPFPLDHARLVCWQIGTAEQPPKHYRRWTFKLRARGGAN